MRRTTLWQYALAGSCRLVLVILALWVAFLLRFDFSIPPDEEAVFRRGLPVALAVKLLVFFLGGLHQDRWWRHLGFPDMVRIVKANVAASTAFTAAVLVTVGPEFPRAIYLLDLVICFLLTAGARFTARLWEEFANRPARSAKGVVIYGAGVAGIALAREIRANPALGYRVLGFLDDDPRKQGATLMGLPVLGKGEDAQRIAGQCRDKDQPIQEIVVTIPSATGRQIRAALGRVRATGLPCRIVPGLGELISGKPGFGNMREISVADLLGRDAVRLETEGVRRSVAGKSVLVTGAAGSIGSELCHQLAELQPRCLVALDQAESEIFRLDAELRAKFPGLNLQPELADIRDPRRLDHVLSHHQVNSVFHAAAYKHVPIVERHICEGIRNNVLGTWNLVQAACRNGVSMFLMISSDKAVNPTSVMGLTKRVAELIVTARRPGTAGQGTRFICLRFGNVLVSNGSVVPIFEKQIAAGGPVTVTHPEVRRYFMTVQEAVQLVLHASTMGSGSEIFVLDMGKPVRILDLARKMITLAGFTPDEDIEIRFTGLRPGEKLFEELKLEGESILPTSHEKIKVFRGEQVSTLVLAPWIAELQHLVWANDTADAVAHMKALVPEYQGEAAQAGAETAAAGVRVKAAGAGAVQTFEAATS